MSICPPRTIAKLAALSKKLVVGSSVTVCLPALIRSASSSPSNGNGPMPSMPFSECNWIDMPGRNMVRHQGRDADAEVDVEPVLQLARRAGGHLVARPGASAVGSSV